jgi:hypothetical protein
MLGAVHVVVPPLLDPPLDDPPLLDPPLDDPPLEEPPELEEVDSSSVSVSVSVSSVGSVDAGALVGCEGVVVDSSVHATRHEPTARNERGRSRRMKHSFE